MRLRRLACRPTFCSGMYLGTQAEASSVIPLLRERLKGSLHFFYFQGGLKDLHFLGVCQEGFDLYIFIVALVLIAFKIIHVMLKLWL